MKSQKGITLISLIIVIVVLLILAAVSIGMLIGDESFINQATDAANQTKNAELQEKVRIATLYAEKNGRLDPEDLIRELNEIGSIDAIYNEENNKVTGSLEGYMYEVDINSAGIHTGDVEEEDRYYTDNDGITVPLPDGFYVSRDSKEDDVKEGLVVVDGNLNEFVWIEVPRTDEVYPNVGTNKTDFTNCKDIETDLRLYSNKYDGTPTANDDEDIWKEGFGITEEEYTKYYNRTLKSIYENEGFYMARYEAGISEPYTNQNPSDVEIYSQANKTALISVTGEEMTMFAKTIIDTEKYTSLVCLGIHWDLMLAYIDKYSTEITFEQLTENSDGFGNYDKNKNNPDTIYAAQNIYDIAGRYHDAIMEMIYPEVSYARGGPSSATNFTASHKVPHPVANKNDSVTFRMAIY